MKPLDPAEYVTLRQRLREAEAELARVRSLAKQIADASDTLWIKASAATWEEADRDVCAPFRKARADLLASAARDERPTCGGEVRA